MFLEELKKRLSAQFDCEILRLVNAVFRATQKEVEIKFATPVKPSEEQQAAIFNVINEILREKVRDTSIKVKCLFEKDFMDAELAMAAFLRFFEQNFSMLMYAIDGKVAAEEAEDGIQIKITLDSEFYKLFKQMDVVTKCNEYFASVTNANVKIKADVVRTETNKAELSEWAKHKQELQLTKAAFRPQRTIHIEDVTEYIGKAITQIPTYIVDADKEEKLTTLCGRVQSPREIVRSSGYVLFKFDLTDHTGTIAVVMFPNEKPDMLKKLNELKDGDEVVISGSVALDTYSGVMTVKANRLSKCRICEPDYLSLPTRQPPKKYERVFEKEYVSLRQESMFGARSTPKSLIGKSYVVFDFETTGVNPLTDKVIEIGAVKIEDGVITKTFNSFINPERDIPREITELTGIVNSDVKDAPVFEEIIADFYKFAYDSVLIAHNMDFDFSFLRFNTKNSGYIFSNGQIDTLSLARKFYAQPYNRDNRPSNSKLTTLAEHIGIAVQNAHRAIDDARMTAEVFLHIIAVSEEHESLENT